MHKAQFKFVTFAIVLFSIPLFAQDAVPERSLPTELIGLPGTTDLFQNKQQLDLFVAKSATEAEEFRQSFLVAKKTESKAVTLARLVQKFRAAHRDQIENLPELKSTFQVSTLEFVNGFRGTNNPIDGEAVYAPFAGKWQGYWRERIVRHHWSGLVKPKDGIVYQVSNAESAKSKYSVSEYQYAWIGDGYGLNLVASETVADMSRHYLLGYVEHLKDGDFNQIVARRPHVGIYLGKGKLIWITAREVFFEESFSDSYSIIGFSYSTTNDALVANEGFQTLYRRSPDGAARIELPKFKSFEIAAREERRPVKN